jgi:transposase
LSAAGKIDLIYGDAARVSLMPCVPYGWQFADEDVFMPSSQGGGLNCFAFLTRQNRCHFTTTCKRVTSEFIFEQLEQVSMRLEKLTVVVIDNAPAHKARRIQERREAWEKRGLYLFYLPRYSPHLNIVEILWRKLKYEWLNPRDYETAEGLFYTVRQALAAVGENLKINFSKFGLA